MKRSLGLGAAALLAVACGGSVSQSAEPARAAPRPVKSGVCPVGDDARDDAAPSAQPTPSNAGQTTPGAEALVVTTDRGAPPSAPAPDAPQRHEPNDVLAAALRVFPEAYRELAKVRYENGDGSAFIVEDVTLLVPAAKLRAVGKAELQRRACELKRELELDCACEKVKLAPAENYAWHSWPDKRVVPVTVQFFIAC